MDRDFWISADEERLGRELSDARVFVRNAARELGVQPEQVDAVALAVHEAVANALEHGRPCADGPGGRIELKARREDSCVVFTVRDCGSFERGGEPAGLLAERGRGLPLMAALVDDVKLFPLPDRTVVRLEKRLAA